MSTSASSGVRFYCAEQINKTRNDGREPEISFTLELVGVYAAYKIAPRCPGILNPGYRKFTDSLPHMRAPRVRKCGAFTVGFAILTPLEKVTPDFLLSLSEVRRNPPRVVDIELKPLFFLVLPFNV